MDKNWQRFHDLRLALNTLREWICQVNKRRNSRLARLNLELYKRFYPKAKEFNYAKIKDKKEWVDFRNICNKAVGKAVDKYLAKEKVLKKEMKGLAEILTVKPIKDRRNLFDTIFISSYSSQGLSDHKYAEVSAKLALDKINYFGIQGEIVEEKDRFSVYAYTSDVEIEIIKLKYFPTEKFVQNCWKYGCQPRVFLPFLPHDYEKERGITYY